MPRRSISITYIVYSPESTLQIHLPVALWHFLLRSHHRYLISEVPALQDVVRNDGPPSPEVTGQAPRSFRATRLILGQTLKYTSLAACTGRVIELGIQCLLLAGVSLELNC